MRLGILSDPHDQRREAGARGTLDDRARLSALACEPGVPVAVEAISEPIDETNRGHPLGFSQTGRRCKRPWQLIVSAWLHTRGNGDCNGHLRGDRRCPPMR
jgi:hypothetical protein